jgi:hypothetical protein
MKAGLALAAASLAAAACHAGPSVATDAGDAASALPAGLRPSDVARRLSLFLWETEPDADLSRAVEASPPKTRDDVRRLATTMLADPRARMPVASFFRLWLQLDTLGTATKDPALYPEFTPELRADMIDEATRLTTFVTFDGDGRFPTLFTADFSFVNERLAPLYGVASTPGQGFVQAALDPAQRSGVITLAGVLANQPSTSEPPVSERGAFVTALLGLPVPPPPPGTEDLPIPSDQSTRDWVLGLDSMGICGACHRQMDPFGLALGQYDAIGRFQTTERGFAINASSSWTFPGGTTVSFEGARELGTMLARRPETRDRFVKQWLKFATGVEPPDVDPSVGQARDEFVAANLDIRALIVAVTATDAFLSP